MEPGSEKAEELGLETGEARQPGEGSEGFSTQRSSQCCGTGCQQLNLLVKTKKSVAHGLVGADYVIWVISLSHPPSLVTALW